MLIAGSVTSTGGLSAIAIKKFGVKNAVDNHPAPTPSKLSERENGAGDIVANTNQRRDQDGNEHD
ncbi:hypothetical protein [Tunturiibacter gelidiferens]|uniref:hypothetical protein n=1 Tax=Tunturiibacter gelidiferens TaxID=3069689 RepID=UPI003D9BF161